MSIWDSYSNEQRSEYIKYLQVYGALTNLFRQKKGDLIPYLDSKFQETVFSKVFDAENVDVGNTPHDVLAVFDDQRIGIGLKTWMNSRPSYQKVMQLKRYQDEINSCRNDIESLVTKVSTIKNERLMLDYNRLGLVEGNNIYHYVTRDKSQFTVYECAYPLVDVENLQEFNFMGSSVTWSDGIKDYKFTLGDSQIWQKFDSEKYGTLLLNRFNVDIMDDPFSFLLNAYMNMMEQVKEVDDIEEIYLPLYSFKSKEVEEKSGLNSWNAAPKNKGSCIPRPLNEVYIPIPSEFHKKHPDFFIKNIIQFEKARKNFDGSGEKPELRFILQLPNGKKIPSLVTQDNMKSLQSGSNHELDENGKRYGQAALGQWLLVDVLGLKDRVKVTRKWLEKKGTDSVRLWRKKNDYNLINIDLAPFGAFEAFMNEDPIPLEIEK